MEKNERLVRHPGLEPLWESVEREHRGQQLAAVLLVTVGMLTAGLTLRYNIWLPFVGALAATLGAFWMLRLLGEQRVDALRRDLREDPTRFVWVYSVVTERAPFGLSVMRSGTLYLYEVNGYVHDFSLPAEKLLLVTKTLNRLLPRAEFGYTEERELKYRGEITPQRTTKWPLSGNE